MDKKTVLVGVIALIVGVAAGFAGGHRGISEQFEGRGDHGGGRWSQNANDNGRGGMMHDVSKMNDGRGMGGAMNNMMGGLEGKTGDALDAAFIDEMIVHHQGAIDMANTLLKGTKRPELIKMANDIIAAQTKEIEQMKAWRTAWFAATSTPAQ